MKSGGNRVGLKEEKKQKKPSVLLRNCLLSQPTHPANVGIE